MVEFEEQQKIIESTSQKHSIAIAKVNAIIDRQMEWPTLAEMEAKQAVSRKVLKIKCDMKMAHFYVKQAKEVTTIYNKPCISTNIIESCLKAKAKAEKDVELYKQRLVEAERESWRRLMHLWELRR